MGKTKLCACLVYSQAELVCVRINMYCAQSLSLLICELLHASGGGCGGWGGAQRLNALARTQGQGRRRGSLKIVEKNAHA